MASELSINLSQLQELAAEVQKTQKTQTVHLADGVVAVVKPTKHAHRRPERHGQKAAPIAHTGRKTYTLESAYGAVVDTGGPRDFDQMIREAKDDRADRLLTNH